MARKLLTWILPMFVIVVLSFTASAKPPGTAAPMDYIKKPWGEDVAVVDHNVTWWGSFERNDNDETIFNLESSIWLGKGFYLIPGTDLDPDAFDFTGTVGWLTDIYGGLWLGAKAGAGAISIDIKEGEDIDVETFIGAVIEVDFGYTFHIKTTNSGYYISPYLAFSGFRSDLDKKIADFSKTAIKFGIAFTME